MEKGFEFLVDTREKMKTKELVKSLNIPHVLTSLSSADFALRQVKPTFKYIVGMERKAVPDLVQSIMQRYKFKPRLFDQVERMANQYSICWLMVSGSLELHKATLKKMGLKINEEAIWGTLASIAVRDNFHVMWLPSDRELIKVAYKICCKVAEGKYQLPLRSRPKYLDYDPVKTLMKVPGITQTLAERLLARFKSLRVIAICKPEDLTVVDGIGPSTAKLIWALFNKEWHQ